MKLWLVRHAVVSTAPGLCYGRLDVEADASATDAAARDLAIELPPGIAVRTSPALRCRQLAAGLHALRPDLACRVDPRLQEIDFGTWEGRTWDAIGADAVAVWTRDFGTHAPGGGETVHALMQRVAQAFDETASGGKDTAWITHAGVIRAARLIASGSRDIHLARDWPDAAVPFGSAERLDLEQAAGAPAAASAAAAATRA